MAPIAEAPQMEKPVAIRREASRGNFRILAAP
jgi:hypothetical protein